MAQLPVPCPNKCGNAKCHIVKKPIVWVVGAPGSGKATQCDKIASMYEFAYLSTGELLRAELKSGSERAEGLGEIIEQAELVPNDIVLSLIKEAMEATQQSSNGFLVEGVPREEHQGADFEKEIGSVSLILFFEASDETLLHRLMSPASPSNKSNDEAVINKRLQLFHEWNKYVLEQYPSKVVKINSEKSIDEVFTEAQKAMDTIITLHKKSLAPCPL